MRPRKGRLARALLIAALASSAAVAGEAPTPQQQKTIEKLVRDLQDTKWEKREKREAAARALGEIGPAATTAVPALLDAINLPSDSFVVIEAANAVARIDSRALFDALLTGRIKACGRGIGALKDQALLAEVADRHTDLECRLEAIDWLADEKQVTPRLLKERAAVEQLPKEPLFYPSLRQVVSPTLLDELVRNGPAPGRMRALEHIHDPSVLANLVHNGPESVRMKALALIDDPSVLADLLRGAEENARMSIVPRLKNPAVLRDVSMKDPAPAVRLLALSYIEDPQELAQIAAKAPDPATRQAAQLVLDADPRSDLSISDLKCSAAGDVNAGYAACSVQVSNGGNVAYGDIRCTILDGGASDRVIKENVPLGEGPSQLAPGKSGQFVARFQAPMTMFVKVKLAGARRLPPSVP